MDSNASHPGLLLIISGPSGVGKTTITHQVEKQLDAVFSVSMTTRPRTSKDVEGEDYFFVTRDEFERRIAAGELLEHAEVFDNFYGTPRQPVEDNLRRGRVVILEIDVQGAKQVRKNMPETLAIFVEPPSEEELLRRLRTRGREDEATIQRRFAKAKKEIAMAHECGAYDRFLVNDDLDRAIKNAVAIVQERLNERQQAI